MLIRLFTILLSLAAEAILAVVFFVLIPAEVLSADIRWLDFAVMTAINIVYVLNIFFPFVRIGDRSHKEVGGLGIRWASTGWYTALAFLFMLANIIYAWQYSHALGFGLQATIQAALLLLFMCGIVASKASIDKAGEVYEREKIVKSGKADVKAAVAGVLAAAEDQPDLPGAVTDRLRRIVSEVRYISPSASADSILADRRIISDCDSLVAYFSDCKMNKDLITDMTASLERNIERRKKIQA